MSTTAEDRRRYFRAGLIAGLGAGAAMGFFSVRRALRPRRALHPGDPGRQDAGAHPARFVRVLHRAPGKLRQAAALLLPQPRHDPLRRSGWRRLRLARRPDGRRGASSRRPGTASSSRPDSGPSSSSWRRPSPASASSPGEAVGGERELHARRVRHLPACTAWPCLGSSPGSPLRPPLTSSTPPRDT